MKTQLSFLKPKVAQLRLLFLTLFSFTFMGFLVRAQSVAGDYNFSYIPTSTYSEITGGTVIGNNNWDDFPPENASLGFNFYYNGSTYSNCYINANGYITFGTTASINNDYAPILSARGYDGAVAGFARDLINGSNNSTERIQYKTTGAAGNRVFTVQWKNALRYNIAGKFNFQIKLYEGSNTVEVHYGGNSDTSNNTILTVQVGLRGATNSDFNNRTTMIDWAATTAGTGNAETNSTTATVRPVPDSIYRWTLTKFTASTVLYGSGTWTAPCGPTEITVQAWGAGGAGGKATDPGPDGGGGGGAYSKKTIAVTAGDSFAYTVGIGGSGSGNNSSRDGSDSWFGSTTFLLAKAGKGVWNNVLTGALGGKASTSIGDTTYNGGNGGTPLNSGSDSGGGGGAAKIDGDGNNGAVNGGGASLFPGGKGGNGTKNNSNFTGWGLGESGDIYGGGGGGGRAWIGLFDQAGGNGAQGYMLISYSYTNTGAPPPVTAISTLTPDPTTDIGCASNAVTLQATGGNTGAGVSTLWVKGTACPTFAYIQEFMGPTYTTYQTSVGTVTSGNRRFTATGIDPNIDMQNVLTPPNFPIIPTVHKYMIMRYRIVSGGGSTEIYFKKSGFGLDEVRKASAPLNADGNWHVMTIDLTKNYLGNDEWNNIGGNITGWRFDYATVNGTVMDIDYLALSSLPVEENTNADDTQITVDASDEDTVFRSLRIADQAALCNGAIPYTSCTPITLHRSDKTFTAASDNNWENASNWSFSGIPNSSNCVFINNSKNLLVNTPFAAAKTIHVSNNASLTITSGNALTVTNSITNLGTGSNFVVQSEGNLNQITESLANTGNITVQRESPMMKNNYTYWSSPVSGQKLYSFSPGTSTTRFYFYQESDDMFYNTGFNTTTLFNPTQGYAIMAPSAYTGLQTFTGNFVGVPNNGTNATLQFPLKLSVGIDKGYNLIGNPYPSNIDFDKLFTINGGSTIDPLLGNIHHLAYFWTNVNPNRAGSTNGTGTTYSGNAYAIYNGTGGIPATSETGSPVGFTPTAFIKVGQGFIVKAKKVDNLIFNNTIRDVVGSSHFFSKGSSSEKDRYWLKLTTPALDVNTILIGYVSGATNNFEWDYDAPLLSVGSDSFYSLLNEDKLGIQGRSYPLNVQDIVTLGTKHFDGGNYTITLGDHEGIFADTQKIYLKDKQNGIITNLSEGSYTFAANIGESATRFEIIYKPETVLATDTSAKANVQLYRDQLDFVIASTLKKIFNIELYDMSGRLMFNQKANAKVVRFNAEKLVDGVYMVRAELEGGEIFTKKMKK